MEFWRFKSVSQEYGIPMVGQYDMAIVLLSIVIACLACYAALTIAYRIISWQSNIIRWTWLFTGASTMGLGIWAMHFTGMLAFSMDSPVHYSVPITILSASPAILGSGITLYLLSIETTSIYRNQINAFILATCIASMHYIGMEAMQMDALLYYDFGLFILSFVVAHLLASIAMTIKFINPKRFLLLSK